MPRIREPLPVGEMRLPGPPAHSEPPRVTWFATLLPLAGAFVMVGVYGGLRRNWLMAVPMVVMSCFSVLGAVVGRVAQRRQHSQRAAAAEATYTEVLEQRQSELEDLRREQQRIRTAAAPDLQELLARVRARDPRVWARRPDDDDFLHPRLGVGAMPSTVAVSAPNPPMPDPRLAQCAAIASEYAFVPDVPIVADLSRGPLGVAGPLPERTAVARALICHLAAHHAPDEMHLLAILSPERVRDWYWLRWLSHTHVLSGGGGRQTLAGDLTSAQAVLKEVLEALHCRQNELYAVQHGEPAPAWPWLLLLVEDHDLVREHPAVHLLLSPEGRRLNATGVFMVDRVTQVPAGCGAVVEVQPAGELTYSVAGVAGDVLTCRPDTADAAACEALARSLAPLRVAVPRSDTALPSNVRLLDLLGVEDVTCYDAAAAWRERSPGTNLKVPIGERRGNQPLLLDLNHTGHGPHGLVAGTTGSGKSELLQTLVIALAMTHHPCDVGFILVDFKGGGAFADLVGLPHTQGFVTDLSGNLTERALVALRAEMDRRKRLFSATGVNDIGHYQRLYWQGGVEPPLPRLVVIIDEFAELVSDTPEFIDGLIGVARVGRSLGVHLILATQSPAGVVKQQIWANAKFRICLRVESRQESTEMLHRPEAASLPRIPGRGYLQVGNNDVFELFQVARVAVRHRAAAGLGSPSEPTDRIAIARVSPLGGQAALSRGGPTREQGNASAAAPTDIELVVQRLSDAARQMGLQKLPSPWPEPLPDRLTLPDLFSQVGFGGWDGRGWNPQPAAEEQEEAGPADSPDPGKRPWMAALLGLLDDPANQRQDPLVFEFDRQDGHLVVVGAPGSGKEMLLRTLVLSLARTHTPDQLHLYLLEFGGQALRVFERLPHVGGVFTPLDDERVRRLLRRLLDSVQERKRLCGRVGVDSLVQLRESQPRVAPPAVLLVITGFMEFRSVFQDEMPQLARLVREGGPYGIHLLLVGDRAGDIPLSIGSVVARRAALRLADTADYALVLGSVLRVGREQQLPVGRGWIGRPPREFQTASPVLEQDEAAQIGQLRRIVGQMDRQWQGARPEPVRTLGTTIPLDELLARVPRPAQAARSRTPAVPVGLDAVRLQPVLVDLVEHGPHFIICSTPQGGKTTLILTWVLSLAELNSPQELQFVLVAGRRNSLGPLEELPHVLEYCRIPRSLQQQGGLDRLRSEIQRRERWLGDVPAGMDALPHIVTVIDDYDEFFSTVGGEPEVQQALDHLVRRGRDVGIHTIVAGPLPSMGVGYADPVVKQIRMGRSGFVLRVLDAGDQNPLGLRIRPAEIKCMPPGRGWVVRNGLEVMLQVATPGDRAALAARVSRVGELWSAAGAERASWPEREKDEER